ncbi:uncharacterized protein LOC108905819 [Anoplophora glabripennis]|uniref:uncharacterized protein LOC108905819 n=1 Tax=Anoplophora glabripennis TaxID=217634 RepID=UPI0008738F61|nr:uncharacterized protein LOC108905819 [Anoplophora glabripennis]
MRYSLFLSIFTIGFCAGNSPCSIKDDPQLEQKYMDALLKYTRCYWSFLTIIDFQSEKRVESLLKNGSVSEDLKIIYNFASAAPDCVRHINELGAACLPLEGINYMNRTQAAYSRILEYMFGNDSQRTMDFIESRGFPCSIKEKLFQKCFKSQPYFPIPLVRQEESVSLTDKEEQSCRFYGDVETCMEDLIPQKCPNATTYIPDMIEIIKTTVCVSENIPSKAKAAESIFEISNYALQSVGERRTRITRGTNGIESKVALPFTDELSRTCEHNRELDRSINRFATCVKSKPIFVTPRDEFIENLRNCSTETKQILHQCLPPKLQYLPEFIFALSESSSKLVYDDSKEIAGGLTPCIPELRSSESQKKYTKCVTDARGTSSNKLPGSKKILCQNFIPISECYVKQINGTCTLNSDLEKFTKDYMKAVKEPCSD